MKNLLKASVSISLLVALVLASLSFRHAAASTILYVIKGGYDGYDCLSPATACGTIDGALSKAAAGDTIEVTAETFYGYGEEVIYVDKSILLSGGWDKSFNTRIGQTIIDAQYLRQGIEIVAAAEAHIEYFTVQNGAGSDNAGGIVNWGTLSIDHCTIQDIDGVGYTGEGILSFGPLTITNSTIRDYSGPAIYSLAGPVTISNSTISNNAHGPGIWIFQVNASIVNSTISGNMNNYSNTGGGIYYAGSSGRTLLIKNVTITANHANSSGGGIYFDASDGGEVLIENSIVAGNFAANAPDCSGAITSQGYNIIGDSNGCTITPTTGDQLDVDPLLASLQYNGGPTPTHRLRLGSPAIDGGNPVGCTDQSGSLLTTDQRGFPRPLDGDSDGSSVCDAGAYEYDPNVIIRNLFLPVVNK